ncbi:MAG: ABC transporter ATP-binding protein [Spirochaetia bacterium]|nr:ABC transporter ATP-binding protein [Spirochaetia bacterium]
MGFILDGLESESYDRAYSDRQLVRRIGAYFRPYRRHIAGVAASIALASFAEAGVDLLLYKAVDLVAATGSYPVFAAVAAGFIAIEGLSWLGNFLRQYLSSKFVGDVVYALRSDAMGAALAHDRSFYDEHASGKVAARVATDTQDFSDVINLVVDFLSNLLVVAAAAGILLAVSPPMAALLVGMAPLAALAALAFRRLARFVTLQAKRASADMNARIQESIAGIGVAKAFRKERSLYRDFSEGNRTAYRFGLRRGVVLNLIFPAVGILSGIGSGLVAWFGARRLAVDPSLTPGAWLFFMTAVGRFWWPMLNLASFWSQLQDGFSAAERVFALIDREPRVRQSGSAAPERFEGRLEYRDVRFSYDGKTTVLDGLTLDVAAGEKLAVVGRTGAGKTSLVRLFLRFYEFQGGSVLVDGRDIRELDIAALRRAVGFVPQDPFLFPGTVRDNIRYSRPDASDAEVERAARGLGSGDWVDDLRGGLDAETGHRGSSLSMGQRQLVALARVLLKDPVWFVLDEATANVDPFTEAQVQDGLESVMRGRTAIVVAHRLTTVRDADRIVVVEDGRIAEQGSHGELLARGGYYARLYEAYFRHQSKEYVLEA